MPKYQDLTKALKQIEAGSKIAVELHQGPDPDAIGAGLFLYEFLRKKEFDPTITYAGAISHPQNRLMVSKLGIQMQSYPTDEEEHTSEKTKKGIPPQDFHHFFFVDHSGKTSEWYKQGKIETGKILGIVDHHDVNESKPEATFTDVRAVGSSSAIMAEYLRDGAEKLFEDGELERLCTALFVGIVTDTNNLRRGAMPLDVEMHQYLSERANMAIVHAIEDPPWSTKWMNYYGRAINTRTTAEGITIASVGYIDPEDRDVIPRTAEQLLNEISVHTVYVIGIRPDIIDISIRTSDAAFDFERLMRAFPEGIGGGKEGSGGIQLPNQFSNGAFVQPTSETAGTIEQLIIDTFKRRVRS